jgi:hypothetical protein
MANKRDTVRAKNLQLLANMHPEMPLEQFKSRSYWSQVKSGAAISNSKATEIEEKYGLPFGWLDRDPEVQFPIIEIDQLSQVLSRMVTAKRISQEEVAGMLQTLLAREKLSQP